MQFPPPVRNILAPDIHNGACSLEYCRMALKIIGEPKSNCCTYRRIYDWVSSSSVGWESRKGVHTVDELACKGRTRKQHDPLLSAAILAKC